MITLVLVAQIATIFQQQVACAFKNGLIVLGGLAVLNVAYFVDDPAKRGYDVKQIKDDFGLRQFFLTALINGSHMSMATASMARRCFGLI